MYLTGHHFFEDEGIIHHSDKKANKRNVRMFNFSKIVNQPRYQDSNQIRILKPQPPPQSDPEPYSKSIEYPVQKPAAINLAQMR